ncbi:GNAT family N-acetyltransferase [Bacteroidota bacterium]
MSSKLSTENIRIRKAGENDIPVILQMINGLADYENLSNEVTATESNLRRFILGDDKFVDVWLAEFKTNVAGHVICFRNFSTFLARPGLYIEELYVKPEYRGNGIGKLLLLKVIDIAREKNYGRVEWAVLDWNEPAIEFYKSMQAIPMDDWKIFRITEDIFDKLRE